MGGTWEFLGDSRSTTEGSQVRLGTVLGLVYSLVAAEDGFGRVLGPSLARFGCSRGPLKGSQADPPTFKNVGFTFGTGLGSSWVLSKAS